MNVYMIYHRGDDGYLFSRGVWGWLPQAEALVFTDLDEVEDIVAYALKTRGWKLEIHTFKLERI